jgi:hypothetical protein
MEFLSFTIVTDNFKFFKTDKCGSNCGGQYLHCNLFTCQEVHVDGTSCSTRFDIHIILFVCISPNAFLLNLYYFVYLLIECPHFFFF